MALSPAPSLSELCVGFAATSRRLSFNRPHIFTQGRRHSGYRPDSTVLPKVRGRRELVQWAHRHIRVMVEASAMVSQELRAPVMERYRGNRVIRRCINRVMPTHRHMAMRTFSEGVLHN